VTKLKEKGYRVVLATNPLFPSIATESRIKWAGLEPSDFELFTTYENYHYCKPNPKYYFEILEKLGVEPKDCMMIGNDVTEDMMTKDFGMQVFLLTGSLINKENKDISEYPNGDFCDLVTYIDEQM
jgi:FMN phosphatase YigB (HAD superfamily)